MLGLTAEQIGTVILGLSMGLIAIMGGQKGKQVAQGRKETPSEMIEVAGAIVSDKAVERMVQSMDALSASNTMLSHAINTDVEAKKALAAAMSENSRALNRNSDVSEDMREQIKDAESKIDRLREELFRSSVSHGGGAR